MAYRITFIDPQGNLIDTPSSGSPEGTRIYETQPYVPSVGDWVELVQGDQEIVFSPGSRLAGKVIHRAFIYGTAEDQSAIVTVDTSAQHPGRSTP